MMNSNAQTYLRTRVMTASPAELRLMLIDGAIRFAEQCRSGLSDRNFEQAYEGSRQCRAILTELLSSLKPENDPVLCDRITSLYTFLISQMMEAMSERDHSLIDQVLELLAYDRETWQLAVEKLAEGETKSEGRAGDVPRDAAANGGDRLHLTG